jgi:hypothetical protein
MHEKISPLACFLSKSVSRKFCVVHPSLNACYAALHVYGLWALTSLKGIKRIEKENGGSTQVAEKLGQLA